MWLFLAFLMVPLIEIALFIQVGGLIGLWPTLLIVVLTAIAGTFLVRTQGLQAVQSLRNSLSELDDPTVHLAHGAMILASGALLLTPGFFTDAVGFLLLVPGFRLWAMKQARKRIKVKSFTMGPGGPVPPGGDRRQGGGLSRGDRVVEGEYTEVTPEKKPTHEPSGWTRH